MNIIVDGSINWYAWQLWVLVASLVVPMWILAYIAAEKEGFGMAYSIGLLGGLMCCAYVFSVLWQPVIVLPLSGFVMLSYFVYKLGERR